MKIDEVSVVIPAYNEAEAIADDLEVILSTMERARWDCEVIVVDDASTDDTAEIVRGFECRGVRLVQHRHNRGAGFARNTGIAAATGEVVVVTDGDGTYPNHDIPRMLERMEEQDLDMVIGARTKVVGTMTVLRKPAKWFIRKLAEWMSGFDIPDLNSGFRAMKKDLFLEFRELLPWGHSWVSTITLAALSSGHEVGFVEIDCYPRKGTSTFHPIKDTYGYLTLVIRAVTWFNPLKIFMPLAILLGLLGFGKLIYDLVNHPFYITSNTIILLMTFLQIFALGLLADLIAKRRK